MTLRVGRGWSEWSELARRLWTSRRPTVVMLRVVFSMAGVALLLLVLAANHPGYDAYSYWSIDLHAIYARSQLSWVMGAFRYSPAAAHLLALLGLLPWGAYYALLLVGMLLCLVALGGRLGLALLLIPSVVIEVMFGNIDLFVAVALGFGLVAPPAWAFLLLTKGTPGIVVIWFAARHEWRELLLAVGTAVVIALPFVVLAPSEWTDWLRASTQYASTAYGGSQIPALPRVLAAGVLVAVGARLNWRWTIAAAGVLALPGLDVKSASAALAILPLYGFGLSADWPSLRDRLAAARRARPAPR